jgi:hypothetical protein
MIALFFFVFFSYFCIAAAGQTLFLLFCYEVRNPFLCFFVGSFVLGVSTLFSSFFVPITEIVSLFVLALALPGMFVFVRKTSAFASAEGWRTLTYMVLGFSALMSVYVFAASWSAWPGLAYDSDLYHIQSVRWLNEHGAVPGVGNLHSRLGHASSWLALGALFNHGPLKGSVPWILPPLVLSCFSAYLIWEVLRGRHPWARIYAMTLLPLTFYYTVYSGQPNFYQDFPCLIIVSIIGCELLYFFLEKDFFSVKHASIICICIAQAFLIKSIPVITVIFVPIVLVCFLFCRGRLELNSLVKMFALPACAAIIWTAWNIIATGYPFFPITIFPVNVDWLMSHDVVASHTLAIRGWARMPGPEYKQAFAQGITYWFFPWLDNLFHLRNLNGVFMAFPLLAGSALWLAVFRKSRGGVELTLLLWPLASIVYWFWLAPDPRFGMEYMWIFFALGASCAVRHSPELWGILFRHFTERKFFIVYIAAIVSLCLIGGALRHKAQIAWIWPGHTVARAVETRVIQFTGQAPFEVYVPVGGDDRCGDADLPCTPSVHQLLEMRKPGDLSAGFRLRKS